MCATQEGWDGSDILLRIPKIIITSIKCEKCWNRCVLCCRLLFFPLKKLVDLHPPHSFLNWPTMIPALATGNSSLKQGTCFPYFSATVRNTKAKRKLQSKKLFVLYFLSIVHHLGVSGQKLTQKRLRNHGGILSTALFPSLWPASFHILFRTPALNKASHSSMGSL